MCDDLGQTGTKQYMCGDLGQTGEQQQPTRSDQCKTDSDNAAVYMKSLGVLNPEEEFETTSEKKEALHEFDRRHTHTQ